MLKNLLYSFAAAAALACASSAAAQQPYSGSTVAEEGAWCWFADPRAIHYENAESGINMSYLGYIDVHGNIKATQMDWTNGLRDEVLVRSYFQPDDHDNPTFLILPDERVFVIYSRHTDEAAFYYRISEKPGDITTLGAEHRLATANNTTYPSPFLLSDDPDHIYLCWRGIGWHPTIARLTMPDANGDVKFDWGPFQMVQSTGARPYAKYFSNGKDKIYVTYTTGHPDNEQPNWVYFNVININGGNRPTLTDIQGKQLSVIEDGKFSVNKTADYKSKYPLTVVDAPSNYRDWVWQTLLDTDGMPVIAMVRITGGKDQHEYFYAKWTGSQWRLTDLADGGGRFHSSNTEYCYSGGMALDPANPSDIYLSIPTEGACGKVYEIWKYTVDASGAVVAKTAITHDSEKNNVRPYVLPGSENSPMRLGWMNGDYYYWIVSKNYPKGYPTSIRADYEWVEDASVPEALATGMASVASPSPLGAFTVSANVAIDQQLYKGTFIKGAGFEIGLDQATALPYAIVNGKRFDSTNKLYTSDAWATNSSGTSGDNWKSLFSQVNITASYDGSRLRIYRDGLLDQSIPASGLSVSEFAIGDEQNRSNGAALYGQALTSEQVKTMLCLQAINAQSIPSEVCTDLVLASNAYGVSIAWTSSHPEIISPAGIFRAPEQPTEVTLTACVNGVDHAYTVTAMPRNLSLNLLAMYTFDRAEVADGYSIVADASPNGYDMQVFGSNFLVDGTLNFNANSATKFSANSYAIVDGRVMDGLRSYSVLVTICPKSLDKQPRIYDFGFNSANSLFLRASELSAGIKYAGGTTTMVTSSQKLQAGTTYKLAVTFDAATHETRIYINGDLAASGTQNVVEPYMLAAVQHCARCYVGRTQWWDTSSANDNGDYCGTIDDLCFYNTALTLNEIRELQHFREIDESRNIDYTRAIANPGFEEAYAPLQGSGVTSDRAIYVPQGWTIDYTNRNENDMTILNSGDLYASLFSAIPTNLGGGSNAFLVRQKWGASSISLTQQCDTLSAGIYRLAADLWQSGLGGNATIWATPAAGAKVSGTASANAEAWQTGQAEFACNGVEAVTFGLTALHNDNGSEKYLGFDNITLCDVTANCSDAQLLQLLERMIDAADALLLTDLDASVASGLNSAVIDAKRIDSSSAFDEIWAAYACLRDMLRAVRGNNSDSAAMPAAADPASQPVYDLSGRCVLLRGSDDAMRTLAPGIYLRGNAKIFVK